MKIAVITLAIIGALASVIVVTFVAVQILKRARRPSWTFRCATFRNDLSLIEHKAREIPASTDLSHPRSLALSYFDPRDIHADGAISHEHAFEVALNFLHHRPTPQLMKDLGEIALVINATAKHGPLALEVTWAAVLLSISCELLRREARDTVAQALANGMVARALSVVWPVRSTT